MLFVDMGLFLCITSTQNFITAHFGRKTRKKKWTASIPAIH